MKFNFKKVASILAATIMLGSTVSFAAAAWPAPFVSDGSSAAAVVYGANAPSTGGDKAAAINLGAELDKSITSTVSAGSSTTGDMKLIEKSNNKFNINDNVSMFYATLDSEELTKVLADGVYTNDDNNEYEYEQTIAFGATSALKATHFVDDDFNDNKPIVGMHLVSGDHILNYTLEYTPDAAEFGTALASLETTELEMLGMSYYIVDASNGVTNGIKLTLLDNANEAAVSEGEDKTITVGDNSYNVKISFIDATDTILEVNGVKTNKLAEGDVFKVADDTYIAVKNILYNAKESGISQVEFSVGTGKIVLENTQEVQMNGEDISDVVDGQVLTSYITNSSTGIETITLQWDLDDDAFIAPGSDLVLPGFETIKFSVGEFTMPKSEMTTIEASDDDTFNVATELTDGIVDLPILYLDAGLDYIQGLGEKSTHKLVSSGDIVGNVALSLNDSESSFFVATWYNADDYESYAFEIDGITDNDGKNTTVLKNLAEGTDITLSEVADTKDRGSITFTLTAANKILKTATVTLSSTTGQVYTDRIVTKEGLLIKIPVANATTGIALGDGQVNINASAVQNNWTMNVTEELASNGNIGTGVGFTATVGIEADDGLEVTDTSLTELETEDGSKVYQAYVASDMATKVLLDKPTNGLNTLDIVYAGDESSIAVYIAEASATVGSVKDSVKVVTDAEVDSVKSKNLIVVGGSCINTVAASMLGSTSPICGDSWASQTGTGPGKYLIQVAASPVNAEKIAMLIAGYETADTQNAVAKVKEGDVSTDVGTKLVGPAAV